MDTSIGYDEMIPLNAAFKQSHHFIAVGCVYALRDMFVRPLCLPETT